jgi:hypothetical protein
MLYEYHFICVHLSVLSAVSLKRGRSWKVLPVYTAALLLYSVARRSVSVQFMLFGYSNPWLLHRHTSPFSAFKFTGILTGISFLSLLLVLVIPLPPPSFLSFTLKQFRAPRYVVSLLASKHTYIGGILYFCLFTNKYTSLWSLTSIFLLSWHYMSVCLRIGQPDRSTAFGKLSVLRAQQMRRRHSVLQWNPGICRKKLTFPTKQYRGPG